MVVNKINIEAWKSNYIIIYARKGEINARSIEACLKDESGNNIDLANKTVTFYALKPDGTQIYNNCVVDSENDKISVELTSQMVSVEGIVNCEFQIFSGDSLLLKIGGIKIIVEEGEDFSEAIESTSEYNTLIHALERAESFSDSIGDMSDLTTTHKDLIVNAINDVNGKTIPITQGGTGGITAKTARTNLGVMTQTVLYSNTNGSNGTITLSDSISNYSKIGIYYYLEAQAGECADYTEFDPSISSVLLYGVRTNDAGNSCFLKSAKTVCENNTISFSAAYQCIVKSSSVSFASDSSSIKIYKVVGYKY